MVVARILTAKLAARVESWLVRIYMVSIIYDYLMKLVFD